MNVNKYLNANKSELSEDEIKTCLQRWNPISEDIGSEYKEVSELGAKIDKQKRVFDNSENR